MILFRIFVLSFFITYIQFYQMDTVVIQLTTPKTMKLLLELQELHLLRVLKKNISVKTKLSDKYAGKLPVDIAEDIAKTR